MRYAMFICVREPGPVDLAASGSAVRLRPAADATTVRVRGHEILLEDGPVAGSEESIAGVDVIEADDLDAAVTVAAAHPAVVAGGAVELRPLWE